MNLGSASSTDITTLLGFTRFLCNSLDDTNNPTDATIVGLLNLEYRGLQSFILSNVLNNWKENTLEGTGNGLINLTDGTNKYAFPTDLVTLDRVEVNYTGNTNEWALATPMKQEAIDDRALANTANDNAIKGTKNSPIYYVRDGNIYLDPIPDATVTGGLKVWCTTLITDLSIGGSGDQITPIFAPAYHEILAYGAAERWLKSRDKNVKAATVQADKTLKMQSMIKFYVNRDQDSRKRMIPKYQSFV